MVSLFLMVITLTSFRVQAGVDATPTIFLPSQVRQEIQNRTVRLYITNEEGRMSLCSGYLATNNSIYTAGHCIRGRSRIAIDIYSPTSSRYERLESSQYSIRNDLDRDAGIITLNQNRIIPGTHSIPQVSSISQCDSDRPFYAAGFGIDANNNRGALNVVRHRRVTEGELITADGRRIHFDAGGVGLFPEAGRICGGDSGGPVFCYVRGAISLVGTTAQVGNFHQSMEVQGSNSSQLCRERDYMSFSELSQHLEIEALQHLVPPPNMSIMAEAQIAQ